MQKRFELEKSGLLSKNPGLLKYHRKYLIKMQKHALLMASKLDKTMEE